MWVFLVTASSIIYVPVLSLEDMPAVLTLRLPLKLAACLANIGPSAALKAQDHLACFKQQQKHTREGEQDQTH